jgi:hypothetical protein
MKVSIILMASAIMIVLGTANCKKAEKNAIDKTTVGAIRWDGWVGKKGSWQIGPIVERTMGPEKFHSKAPWFSKVISKDSISIDGTTQEIMDEEIAYAKDAGIDYWAYCWYPDGCGLESARKLQQTSQHAKDSKLICQMIMAKLWLRILPVKTTKRFQVADRWYICLRAI